MCPPQTGDYYERVFETAQGSVDILADIVVEDDTMILKDIVIFGRNEEPLTGLIWDMLRAKRAIMEEVAGWGFKKLRVMGQRVATSSSANPGKSIDLTIDLRGVGYDDERDR